MKCLYIFGDFYCRSLTRYRLQTPPAHRDVSQIRSKRLKNARLSETCDESWNVGVQPCPRVRGWLRWGYLYLENKCIVKLSTEHVVSFPTLRTQLQVVVKGYR
ncbi:hypothetical protein KGM_205934 [Danaus plexippus plexippus]|uniref:Uncharacterized protein n=1 Tax=Danaus plexippus plexippus TaxID=278856 RepID=A0A212FNX5_DANPL|nr:hypothetical protein KGM_205934 [Danaus plexippus plexippus]